MQSRYVVLLICCLTFFLGNVNFDVLNITLPFLLTHFHQTTPAIPAQIFYIIAFSGTLLMGGRLSDYVGHRNIFLISLAGFCIFSLGTIFAVSLMQVFILHIAQGICCALLACNVFAISLEQWLPAIAISALTSSGLIGILAAPLLNSWLQTKFNGSVIFISEAILSALLFIAAWRSIPRSTSKAKLRFDLLGGFLLLIFALGLTDLVNNTDFTNFATLEIPGFIMLLALLLFIVRTITARSPFITLSLLLHPIFLAALGLRVGIQFLVSACLLFLVLYLQNVFHYSAFTTALYLFHFFIPAAITALLTGFLLRYLSSMKIMLLATLIFVVTFWLLLTQDDIAVKPDDVIIYLSILGATFGFILTANNFILITALPASYHGFTAGFIYFIVIIANGFSYTISNMLAQMTALKILSENFLRLGLRVSHQQYTDLTLAIQNFQLDHFLRIHYSKHLLQKMIPSTERIYPHAFASVATPYTILLLICFAIMAIVSLNAMKKPN